MAVHCADFVETLRVTGIVVVWRSREIAVLPVVLVGPPWMVAVISYAVLIPGHPTFVAFPNDRSFPSSASSFVVADEVLVDSSTVVHANDDPGSRSSNRSVSLHKRMGLVDSSSSRSHSGVSDTSVLPRDATTSHCRSRFRLRHRGPHRHRSQV